MTASYLELYYKFGHRIIQFRFKHLFFSYLKSVNQMVKVLNVMLLSIQKTKECQVPTVNKHRSHLLLLFIWKNILNMHGFVTLDTNIFYLAIISLFLDK